MKNIFQYTPIRIATFSLVYLYVLIGVSPVIDHQFTDLQTDIRENKSYFQILLEISVHIVILAVSWYLFHSNLKSFLERILEVKVFQHTEKSISIVSGLVLVGLQKNLLDKIKYITTNHPVRLIT
jgi:hypothetical protein